MASESNYVQADIPHFDGHYDNWSMLMENFLQSKEYWPIVEDGIGAPAEGEALTNAQKAEFEARKLKNLKTKNYLFQAIDRPILETILCKETSKDIWDSMKKKYQSTAREKHAQLQALRRDFETLQMKKGESVMSYCAKTMEISNKMRFHGEKMTDVTIVEKILRSLTPKYDCVVCSIEESKDIEEGVEVEKEEEEIEDVEMKAAKAAVGISEPMMTTAKTEEGILTNPKLPNDKDEKPNFAESNEVETLLMAVLVEKEPEQNVCYLDTGCSNHIFGDSSTVSAIGKGDIKIRTKNGFEETIPNVLYISALKSNLLSVGQLQEKGYVITIEKSACEIYNPTR
ncbi:hypothetical protein KY284_019536 [Solanum tuberosum]|nr:hypothetical protein KY284_019536 [Solanum tuberosum]